MRYSGAEAASPRKWIFARDPRALAVGRRLRGGDRARPARSLLVLGGEHADTAGFAKALARGLFGWQSALVEVAGGDYRDGVRVSELLGVVDGDERETSGSPLRQRRLDSAHLKALVARRGRVGENAELPLHELNPSLVRPLSVVLFHEVEKAHPMLWDALLQIGDGWRSSTSSQILQRLHDHLGQRALPVVFPDVHEPNRPVLIDDDGCGVRNSAVLRPADLGIRQAVALDDLSPVAKKGERPVVLLKPAPGLGRVVLRDCQ